MTRPNILILMVDQLNGTLFPDGPADWLHAPNLRGMVRDLRARNRCEEVLLELLSARDVATYLRGRLGGEAADSLVVGVFPLAEVFYRIHEIRTAEADVEVNTRRDLVDLLAEVRLGGAVHLFGGRPLAWFGFSRLEQGRPTGVSGR